ncbi:MAG: type II toxin-antitoxin system VapC family toxin [Chloroflexota bacterium]
MADTPVYVLDTFALLAYLRDEPSADRIEKALADAKEGKNRLLLSIINLGEILYIVERRGGVAKVQDTLALIRQLPIEILAADERSVFDAAHVKASHALSYANAFAVAAAVQEGAVILTGDPEFASVESIANV